MLLVATVLALCAALQWGQLDPELQYSRAALAQGEVWRLLSAHLIHLGWPHLLLDSAGLILIAVLVGVYLRPRAWVATALLCMLVIDAGLWWLNPAIEWYVGLSGLLHGLVVAGALAGLRDAHERKMLTVLLAGVVVKLVWEWVVGPTPGTAALADGPVVPVAHLYGAVGGLIAGIVILTRPLERRGTG